MESILFRRVRKLLPVVGGALLKSLLHGDILLIRRRHRRVFLEINHLLVVVNSLFAKGCLTERKRERQGKERDQGEEIKRLSYLSGAILSMESAITIIPNPAKRSRSQNCREPGRIRKKSGGMKKSVEIAKSKKRWRYAFKMCFAKMLLRLKSTIDLILSPQCLLQNSRAAMFVLGTAVLGLRLAQSEGLTFGSSTDRGIYFILRSLIQSPTMITESLSV